jgi:hypothetical protein
MSDLNRLMNVLSLRADAVAQFENLLEWKLLRGSHEFPGSHGGTCINEAAIVAAGYPYRPVYCVKDMPASFSRPIAMLALCLNDTLDDELRHELLMPFVARLDGTADAPKIEIMRADLMLRRAVVEILAPALARAGYAQLAERARSLSTPMELIEIARRLRNTDRSSVEPLLVSAFEHAADGATQWRAGRPTEVAFCTFSALRDIAAITGGDFADEVYRRAAAILDGALEIGNQAEPVGLVAVMQRMDAAKRQSRSEGRDAGVLVAA